jgi:hypothetical protein
MMSLMTICKRLDKKLAFPRENLQGFYLVGGMKASGEELVA